MTASSPGSNPAVIGVVIPARDEMARIDGCLAAVADASIRLRRPHPRVELRVVVVADACTDQTAQRLAEWPDVHMILISEGRVGAARAAGVRHLLDAHAGAAERLWIANTDADSLVPPDWLLVQHGAARRGTALLLGTVRPDPGEADPALSARWYARHQLSDGHRHVHGANLGVRADWYLAAGGFPDVAAHEDVALARAVTSAGGVVERTGAAPVVTSARRNGRAPGGLADYLRDLEEIGAEPGEAIA